MKKMRKLIPAFAMLMVAAIMMTTASFAWFTMNDQVVVTGMQVQAKASGNLVIGTSKMTAVDNGIEVKFDGTKKSLIPITHVSNTAGWADVNGVNVDPIYGTTGTGAALNEVTVGATADNHFAEYVVYLATAGETATTGNLQFNLSAISGVTDNKAANAYTIAFYVVADNETIADVDWNAPDFKYNQLQNSTRTDAFVNTNVSVTVPSTYGKVSETAVGLMVIMRVYADGALPIEGGVEVPDTNTIVAVGADMKYNATTHANYHFYADAEGKVEINKAELEEGQTISTVASYYWDGTSKTEHENVAATYISNAAVPSVGTSFEIDFKVA